jgi:hypothetical protein
MGVFPLVRIVHALVLIIHALAATVWTGGIEARRRPEVSGGSQPRHPI